MRPSAWTYLVTGAEGAVGSEFCKRLPLTDRPASYLDAAVWRTDLASPRARLDVTDRGECFGWLTSIRPDVIWHLAGSKHAPEGEIDPAQVARVNIDGTLNVLAAAAQIGAKVITASTCKACDPETAYGASKLIAERATLNAGGVVVRFHNVAESGDNVFRFWESLPPDQPIPVTDCWRYFTPMENAVDLLVAAVDLPSGRYACDPGEPRWMPDVAAELYPGRDQVRIPARRGDRHREPLVAACEQAHPFGDWLRIVGAHDPDPLAEQLAA